AVHRAVHRAIPPAPVTTVSAMPDARRRLERRGYSHVKDSAGMGFDSVTYKRKDQHAEFMAELLKWHGQNRIWGISFTCNTDKDGLESDTTDWWDAMKHDCYAMMNCSEDYH